jgi:hypothetical protein
MMKNSSFVYLLVFVAIFTSCSPKNQAEEKNIQEYKTKYFSLLIPDKWKIEAGKNIDAHALNYFIANEDTIIMEVSSYASNLAEPEPDILPKSLEGQVDSIAKVENYVIFVPDDIVKKGIDIDDYRKQNVSFKKVGIYNIKIITPRNTGNGITGMYCDSLGIDETIGRIKMNMYGRNLKANTENELLQVINKININ